MYHKIKALVRISGLHLSSSYCQLTDSFSLMLKINGCMFVTVNSVRACTRACVSVRACVRACVRVCSFVRACMLLNSRRPKSCLIIQGMLHVNCWTYCTAITEEFLHREYKVALHFIVLADQHTVKLQLLQSTSRY